MNIRSPRMMVPSSFGPPGQEGNRSPLGISLKAAVLVLFESQEVFFGKYRGYLCSVISDYLLRAWCHFVLPKMLTLPRHWQSKAGLDTRNQQIHQWVGDRFCQGRRTPGRYSCGGHNPQPECSCSDQGPTVMRPQLFSSPMSALPRSQPRVRWAVALTLANPRWQGSSQVGNRWQQE